MNHTITALYSILQIVVWAACISLCVYCWDMSWWKGTLLGTLFANIILIPIGIWYWVGIIKQAKSQNS